MSEPTTPPMEPMLKIAEVASMLRVSEQWVWKATRGEYGPIFPHYRVGKSIRFRREQVEQWLADQEATSA